MVQQTGSPSPQKPGRRRSIRVLAKKAAGTPKQKSPKNVVGSAKKTPKQKSLDASPLNLLKQNVENKTPLNKKRKKSKSPSVFIGSSGNKDSAELKMSPFVEKEPPSNTPRKKPVGNISKKDSFIETASPGLQKGLVISNSTPEMSVGGKKKKQSLSRSFSGLEKKNLGGKPKKQSINSPLSNTEKSIGGQKKESFEGPWNTPERMSVGGKSKKQSVSVNDSSINKKKSSVKSPHHTAKSPVVKTPLKGTVLEVEEAMDVEANTRSSIATKTHSAELKKSPYVGKEPPSNSNTPGRTSVGNINKKNSFIETASPGLQKRLLSSNSTPEMSVGGKKKKQSLNSSFSGMEKTPLGGKPKKQSINSPPSNTEKSIGGQKKESFGGLWNTPERMSVGGKSKKQSLSVNDSSINNKKSSMKSPHLTAKSPVVKTPVKGTVLEVEEAMDVEASTRSSIAASTARTSESLSDKELEHAAHIKFQNPENETIAFNEIRGSLMKNGIANVQTIKISEPRKKNKLRYGVITFKDDKNLEKFLNLRIPLMYKGFEIGRTRWQKAVGKPSKRASVVPPQGSPPKKSKKSPLQVASPAEAPSKRKRRHRRKSSKKKGLKAVI